MANLNKIKLPDGTTVDITDGRIPSLSGNSGKVLKVNAAGTGLNWDELGDVVPLVGHVGGGFQDWMSAIFDGDDTSELNAITCDLSVSEIISAIEDERPVYIIGTCDFLNQGSDWRFVFSAQTDVENSGVLLVSMCHYVYNFVWGLSGNISENTDYWELQLSRNLTNAEATKLNNLSGNEEENVIEQITLNSTVQSVDENKNVTLSAVTSLRVNGTDYAPDGSGKISFSVSGGGGGVAALDVSDDNNGNLTLTVINTSNTLQVADDNAGNIALSLV